MLNLVAKSQHLKTRQSCTFQWVNATHTHALSTAHQGSEAGSQRFGDVLVFREGTQECVAFWISLFDCCVHRKVDVLVCCVMRRLMRGTEPGWLLRLKTWSVPGSLITLL